MEDHPPPLWKAWKWGGNWGEKIVGGWAVEPRTSIYIAYVIWSNQVLFLDTVGHRWKPCPQRWWLALCEGTCGSIPPWMARDGFGGDGYQSWELFPSSCEAITSTSKNRKWRFFGNALRHFGHVILDIFGMILDFLGLNTRDRWW